MIQEGISIENNKLVERANSQAKINIIKSNLKVLVKPI